MKKEAIFCLISLIVIMVTIHFYLNKIDEKVSIEISIAGTAASLLGLVLVLAQIIRLKSIAEESERTAKQTKEHLMAFLSAIDIGKAMKIVQETQIYNRGKKYELSIVRMQELKEILITVRNHPSYASIIDVKYYNKLITNVSIDICSMEKSAEAEDESSDPVTLNKNLDVILTTLNDLHSKIKLSGV